MSLIEGFVSLANERLEKNASDDQEREVLELFSLPKPLPMRLEGFIDNFIYRLDLQQNIIPYAFLIIEKFFDRITLYNIHKLVFTALVLVYKFFSDMPASNNCLEKIGLLKTGELARLEISMLKEIDWIIGFLDIEKIEERLIEAGKMKDIRIDDCENDDEIEDDDTDFTEYGSNCSFSELSAFFPS
ncbi:hypothetical protein SteCoe_31298 [Stentor coeruleus]|uniref:Cyclin N-terminal domain-containing protein n=1 Tax=Stentor coeruleus TaxID=5963 RepID=A0A1R2B1P0_9CILI|nr:hypothetical protein SteCoe_31298 [Stentor coeruleus]